MIRRKNGDKLMINGNFDTETEPVCSQISVKADKLWPCGPEVI